MIASCYVFGSSQAELVKGYFEEMTDGCKRRLKPGDNGSIFGGVSLVEVTDPIGIEGKIRNLLKLPTNKHPVNNKAVGDFYGQFKDESA